MPGQKTHQVRHGREEKARRFVKVGSNRRELARQVRSRVGNKSSSDLNSGPHVRDFGADTHHAASSERSGHSASIRSINFNTGPDGFAFPLIHFDTVPWSTPNSSANRGWLKPKVFMAHLMCSAGLVACIMHLKCLTHSLMSMPLASYISVEHAHGR